MKLFNDKVANISV